MTKEEKELVPCVGEVGLGGKGQRKLASLSIWHMTCVDIWTTCGLLGKIRGWKGWSISMCTFGSSEDRSDCGGRAARRGAQIVPVAGD